jgi:hypothetical protein
MTEKANSETIRDLPHEDVSKAVSRRNFIKGVITSGVAVSSAGYLFRASSLLHGQESGAGAGERLITLNVNGQQRRVDAMKQETLAPSWDATALNADLAPFLSTIFPTMRVRC